MILILCLAVLIGTPLTASVNRNTDGDKAHQHLVQAFDGRNSSASGIGSPRMARGITVPKKRKPPKTEQCTYDAWYICKEEDTGPDFKLTALDIGYKTSTALAVAGAATGLVLWVLGITGILWLPGLAAAGFGAGLVFLWLAYVLKEHRNEYSWKLWSQQRQKAKERLRRIEGERQ